MMEDQHLCEVFLSTDVSNTLHLSSVTQSCNADCQALASNRVNAAKRGPPRTTSECHLMSI